MDSIVYNNDFDIKKVDIDSKVRVNTENQARNVFISYNKKQLVMQLPECIMPYGINKNMLEPEKNKYSVDVSFKNIDERECLQKFQNNLEELKELIITKAFERKNEWFSKPPNNRDSLENNFTEIIKYSKDKTTGEINDKYAPTFKIKLNFNSLANKFNCKFYDTESNEISSENILNINTKNGKIIPLIKFNSIWIAANNFGCTWDGVQAMITPSLQNNVRGCLIKSNVDKIEDESDED